MKNLNAFFPWIFYKRISFILDMPSSDIVKLLSDEIAKPPKSIFGRTPIIGNKFYMGDVSSQGFEIMQITYTRNSFLPRIYGRFIPVINGTQVNIQITLHPLIIAFSILICAPLIMGFIFMLGFCFYDYPNNLNVISLAMFPLGLLIAYYFFALLGFGFEANAADKYITSFFNRIRPPV